MIMMMTIDVVGDNSSGT